MREPILKAVAMPMRVFWAPMMLAGVNFAVQMGVMVILMGAFPGQINPIVFIATFLLGHAALAFYGARDPHLARILQSRGPFMRHFKNVYRARGSKYAS